MRNALFVSENTPSICGGEMPADASASAIGAGVPSAGAAVQFGESGDPITAEALARPQTCLKLGGIKPTAMFGRVVNGETRPQPAAVPVAKAVDERLRAVGVEVVQQQMNGLGRPMGPGDPLERLGELRRLAVGRGVGVMATALGLHDAENVRGSPA